MKTLTLNLETLRVQSFAVTAERRDDTPPALPNAERTRPQICDPVTAWC